MRVKELIEFLHSVDQDLEVRVWRDTPVDDAYVHVKRSFINKTEESYLLLEITHYCGE